MPYDPPRGGVVRAEFDPGLRNAILIALRRQIRRRGGGSSAQNSTPISEMLLPQLYDDKLQLFTISLLARSDYLTQ